MSGETQVEVQIIHHAGNDGNLISKLSSSSSGLQLHSSGGSTGEDSSGEEPSSRHHHHHHHHHVVLPKKIRLKEPISIQSSSSSLLSMICHGGGGGSGSGGGDRMRDEDGDDDDDNLMDDTTSPDPDDDNCSNNSPKNHHHHHHSLTSGENSDADPDPDDHSTVNLGSHSSSKSEDSSSKNCRLPIECDVCNMRFSNGANMRRHRMRHSGIKPFECKICQKRFFRKDHLAEHMATHSKLLPFRCPICNKGFQRQIAMRAHFQNEHVGGSQDVVKACPLCAYKAGSMKSLRVHFYSRHGIDLDNPMPHSPSLLSSSSTSNGRSTSSPPGSSAVGEYSELAHALGFEDRGEKSSDSSMIPSHFLVPQIEISSNSPYPAHFPFNPDSSYMFPRDEKHNAHRGSPQNISPHSDSNIPTSSDLVKIVVKKESVIGDDSCADQSGGSTGSRHSRDYSDSNNDVQDMPEDLTLSSSNGNSYRSPESSPKCSSSSKLSPLKSLLREEWRPPPPPSQDATFQQQGGTSTVGGGGSGGGTSVTTPRDRSDSSSGHSSNSNFQNQSCDGEAITSSNGPESGSATASHSSMYGRRGIPFPALHQCVYCGIIFPDKTLYFLHKGCHSEMNPWRCNICGELCNDVYDFNSHLLSKSHQ